MIYNYKDDTIYLFFIVLFFAIVMLGIRELTYIKLLEAANKYMVGGEFKQNKLCILVKYVRAKLWS